MNYRMQFLFPKFVNSTTGRKMPNDTGWQTRHLSALQRPNGFEIPIVRMIEGWASYADEHSDRYENSVGNDGVMGREWARLGKAIHGLLDGETGRLDCGTLSTFIHETLTAEGFDFDQL